ncbi:LacI family DNA-binding transcriptional regulator [Microlunatus soli]|uniref:DNA-binding transcriptional regulator, LacI/PurR family n=1 Tax=Microlunatus soli TaxID=630515 RepID=A0A1H1Q2B7_9ACTN|nr:LacI family DNA-binding transcriptional regulator [Microlunatus soli]SDS17540.1 DNA-binding transcriptional regulator, LacI/PurR family [Microlunatus soli]
MSLDDVARLAGVSTMTVSRVLNSSGAVSKETRARVVTAATTLNYRPNLAAKTLSSGRARSIGVITMEGAVDGPTSALAGIEQDARALGYAVTMSILPELTPESIADAVDYLQSQAVAGIVVNAPHSGLDDSMVTAMDTPMVAMEGIRGRTPVVAVDQVRGAELATQHLIDLGHTAMHHIGGPEDRLEALERRQGWEATLAAAGLEPLGVSVGDWSPESGYELARAAAAGGEATALFVANDLMAIGALRALSELGIAVPDQVSVVGFDDIAESAFLTPSLTTVHYDFYELGRRTLTELLSEVAAGEIAASGTKIMLEPSLIVRESSGPAL